MPGILLRLMQYAMAILFFILLIGTPPSPRRRRLTERDLPEGPRPPSFDAQRRLARYKLRRACRRFGEPGRTQPGPRREAA